MGGPGGAMILLLCDTLCGRWGWGVSAGAIAAASHPIIT